ncbi:hypothetical protein BDV93DRAFT_552959 [Ceratobasidium sp. AG-I]|nr:hypothetical protein BDV93DRAFT_552959 [Ceratobasidium sp. AG-I]
MTTPSSAQSTVKDFLGYPFHQDTTFLEGLQLLLGQPVVDTIQRGGPLSPELEQSLLGPKLFFFNRLRNINLTPEVVQEYTQSHPLPESQPTPAPPKTPDEEEQLSLAELTRLIETGQTHLIPHNDTIPGGVQASCLSPSEEPSPPKAPILKKPWEVVDIQS